MPNKVLLPLLAGPLLLLILLLLLDWLAGWLANARISMQIIRRRGAARLRARAGDKPTRREGKLDTFIWPAQVSRGPA